MIRAGLVVTLACAGGQAVALVPLLPTCYAGGTGPEAAFSGYEPAGLGNGFVRYDTFVTATNDHVFVLEYCPTALQLALTLPVAGAGSSAQHDMIGVFDGMIASETPYTMEQMRDALIALDADVTLAQVDYESCACATFGK